MSASVDVYLEWQKVSDFLDLGSRVFVNCGPPSYEGVSDSVGQAVIITVGSGPGLSLEHVYDLTAVSVDIAGEQTDPDSAAALARLVDRKMLAVDRPRTIGGLRVMYVSRAGGPPAPVGVDDGDRWHLSCSYLWQVRSGL